MGARKRKKHLKKIWKGVKKKNKLQIFRKDYWNNYYKGIF